jgi:hypothetical protein
VTNLPRLDPDEAGNAHLHELIDRLHPDDAAPFVEKLTTQPLRARFHTYRELLLGAHLRQSGANFRYEQLICGKTPDWSLCGEDSRLLEVIDVVTLHQRNEKEQEISASVRSSGSWSGWIGIPPDHIYRNLSDKAGQYSELVRKAGVPYVLGVFGEFVASLSPQEIQQVLYRQHNGWFATVPEVSGVIYFRERNFSFEFSYFSNPAALYPSKVVSGQPGAA